MCGILGFTGPARPELAARGLELLRHRGPDAAGVRSEPGATLAAARLAIVGVTRGDQPLANEAGDVVAVVNGELYDHAAVRERLERRGHRFATDSDAEIVVHLYEEEGESFAERLEGIFALALWDARRARLLLVRDPLGIKPLFWTESAGSLRFASEFKALLADPDLPRRLDPVALDAQLALGFVTAGRTLLDGVRELPPGHLLRHERGATTLRPYRRPTVVPRPLDGDPVAGFRDRFERAVRSQLASEVPMAFALSGGLDSSLVVAVAARLLDRPVRTFSIGTPGGHDERSWASLVAEHCRTDHTEIELGGADLAARLPGIVWHLEEPKSGPVVAHDAFFERVAREAKVVLTGEGADELTGGYDRLKTACGPAAWLPAALARRAYNGRSVLLLGRSRLYADRFARELPRRRPEAELLAAPFARRGAARRDALLAFEQREMLPGGPLWHLDRMSMAHAVEARVPFLDLGLVDWINRLPGEWKLRLRGEKRLLREAARGLLPERVRTRAKVGHRDPLGLWRRDELPELAGRVLDPATVAARGLFRPAAVERLRSRAARGGGGPFPAIHLLRLVQLELWQRQYLDPERIGPPAPPPPR